MFWRLLPLALLTLGACDRAATPDAYAPSTPPPAATTAGPTPAASETRRDLLDHVRLLAHDIGERNTRTPQALDQTADAIADTLADYGYTVVEQRYPIDGTTARNLAVRLEARDPAAPEAREIVVIGAHYDSARGTPGADDNATGVAVLLELARTLAAEPQPRTLLFVAFTNEEPPWFGTPDMGSVRFAEHAVAEAEARGERIVAMLSLESLGYFRDEPGSQQYPPLISALYPDRGDFLAVVGDLDSAALVERVVALARGASDGLPIESLSAPAVLPGVDWSDHAAFWAHGIPAVMLTDTATYRNPHYHEPSDTLETLDEVRLRAAYRTVEAIVRGLGAP